MTRPHPITEDRIRERAYRLWLDEGQPQGKSSEHWEKARELLAREAAPESMTRQGEFPTTADRSEQKLPKKRRPSVSRKPSKRRAM